LLPEKEKHQKGTPSSQIEEGLEVGGAVTSRAGRKGLRSGSPSSKKRKNSPLRKAVGSSGI